MLDQLADYEKQYHVALASARPHVERMFEFGKARNYLGRYTHRVTISNLRILAFQDGQVTSRAS